MAATQMVRDAGLDAVIGMYPAVHRLRTTVVAPWASSALGDPASHPPHRVLVYGVEGSGVTFIADRLADELGFIGVASVVVPNVDEVVDGDPAEVLAILGAPETRDLALIGVCHRPWDLPIEAFAEGGFERMVFVSPPDWDARRFRIWETPWGSRLPVADLDRLVVATEGWSGSDIAGLGPVADGGVEAILHAVSAGPAAAAAWLAEARTMIRSLDSYGRVDDLVGYLQRYRLL